MFELDTFLIWLKPSLPYLGLSSLVWLTYFYTLHCGFVSDDILGIAEYDGKLQGLEYGMISRWVRYHICGGDFPSNQKFPDGKPIPLGKIPGRHHFLSVLVFHLSILSTYHFLSHIVGSQIALLATGLFIVHPVVTQGVAWISGLGYPLSLLWMTIGFNLLHWFYSLPEKSVLSSVIVTVAFLLIQVMAINALFIALTSFIILLFLGYYPFALLSFLISFALGFEIVRHTIVIRATEFKKQNMGHSTYIKPRKLIVAFKTLYYYYKHVLFPKRMGLYHKWGYHYDKSVEREDWMFVLGLISTGALAVWFFLTPEYPIKFGILWFYTFLFIFLNWITIQQFVTERYLLVPSLGVCIILATLLKDYMPIYYLILGMYLVRTWSHLPTYDNELRFYLSNTWNFEDSEVAYGNLGVTHLRIGQIGTALDVWHTATRVNPEYDVPYFNIYSHNKSNAMFQIQNGNFQAGFNLLQQAYPYLEKCVNAPICHFKNDWSKELAELKGWLDNPMSLIEFEKNRQLALQKTLLERRSKSNDSKDIQGIDESLSHIKIRLQQMDTIKIQQAPQIPGANPQTRV